jgi:hypothetical protein
MDTSAIVSLTFDTFVDQQEDLLLGVIGPTVKCLPVNDLTGETLIPGGYWGDYDGWVAVKKSDLDGVTLAGIRRTTFRGAVHHMKEFSERVLDGAVLFHLKCDQPPR